MLIQVVWGAKLRVNHINECMPPEVDWGAHETHQNGYSITKVTMDGCMLSEVDWGTHDSRFCLSLVHIHHDVSQMISSPNDCGEDYHKGHLPPSHGVPERFF